MTDDKIIIAGFGGQGVLRIGQMIAHCGLDDGKEVSFLPSYGSEMRGGTCNCSVYVCDEAVSCPIIRKPNVLIIMNQLSLDKFQDRLVPGGKLIINSSIVAEKTDRTDVDAYYVPAVDIALAEGNDRGANMVMLGAYIALTGSVSVEAVEKNIDESFTGRKARFAASNKLLVEKGVQYIREHCAVH